MFLENIEKNRSERKAQILSSFKNVENKSATIITKSDFDQQFPTSQYEVYSVASLTKFRETLNKSEDVENKDAAFIEATKDLKHFLVVSAGSKIPTFVRKKVSGE